MKLKGTRIILCLIFLVSFVISSESDDNEEEEFVPFKEAATSSSISGSSGSGNEARILEEILTDESVALSLNCEKSLGSSEEALKSFVMKSLDFKSDETLEDLERPSCRAFFDRNGHQLSKEQLKELISSERGRRIVEEGEVLEFFSDFSEFTLKDFDLFPSLQVGKIRNLSSIPAEVLLNLVKGRGYLNAGRLERIPETFGERIFENETWRLDPEIWQLFTLEGIAQVHSVSMVEKFAKFLAERGKFERLLFTIEEDDDMSDEEEEKMEEEGKVEESGRYFDQPTLAPSLTSSDFDQPTLATSLTPTSSSLARSFSKSSTMSSTVSSDTSLRSKSRTSLTSTTICKSIAKYSNLLTRWAVQSEELMLYLIELPEISRLSSPHLETIQNSVKNLIKTRIWLKEQLKNRCSGATEISDVELLKLTNFKTILESPLSWRLKEALRISIEGSQIDSTPMTRNLFLRLSSFPFVIDFYRSSFRPGPQPQNDHLLTHFFLVNEISDLETIFEEEVSLSTANEKLVLSIALRRILLLLLCPSIQSSNVIQDALNYVFSARSPFLVTSDSNEILRWFRQAQDLQAVPVLDRLIRSFGHEFDVAREIRSILNNRQTRLKLFSEAQSAFVRLLTALSNGLSEHLIEDAPKILVISYLDPGNALLKMQVPDLPVHPSRRPHSQEEIADHGNKVEQVREHNAAIAKTLETSLAFLQTLSIDPDTAELSPNLAGFVQPNFAINFENMPGFDAGGLRRTWLSALLRVFGDSQRMLFPLHLEYGGRTPSALLDPKIMSYLGALHGKALQIGVKPDWFFTRRYTHSILFSKTVLDPHEMEQIVLELYPDIFGSLDLIAEIGSEEAAVEYFNSSEFPTIEGLTADEISTVVTTATATNTNSTNTAGSDDDDADGPVYYVASTVAADSDNDSVTSAASENIEIDQQVPIAVVNPPNSPTATTTTNTVNNGPPRHSFSRMLVFDVRYLAQEKIYNGPRHTITALPQIADYRAALLSLLSANLLHGSHAYWRTFSIFFDAQFRGRLESEFLHDLLEPPQVGIEDILMRVQFHKSCDSTFLIDDETDREAGADDEAGGGDSSADTTGMDADTLSSHKKARSSPSKISNITARTALTRILSTSFTTPEAIYSLLSFSTGCPQIPPAGLDALRITVHCFTSTSPQNKLSKSHTCTNLIDFYSSMHYKATKEAFLESVISSSGFGFA